MTSISFTSGELLDIISSLEIQLCQAENKGDANLAMYYFDLQQQFQKIFNKTQDFVPENRVANLVLASN